MSKFTLEPFDFNPPTLRGGYGNRGTGKFQDKRCMVVPSSMEPSRAAGKVTDLAFANFDYSVNVMSFEIDTKQEPNWFGVCFRKGIESFDSVNIFCHPIPSSGQMYDPAYPTRTGNWPHLFRYVEMLGSQIAAVESNQVLIVPFFSNATYASTGLFGPNWQEIVEDILQAVREETLLPCLLQRVNLLKHVVLSNFSAGRGLMYSLRRVAGASLDSYLREIWDFDGVQSFPAPYTKGNFLGFLYDQQQPSSNSNFNSNSLIFNVPGNRWLKYPGLVPSVHGFIPEMCVVHAASISNVGQ